MMKTRMIAVVFLCCWYVMVVGMIINQLVLCSVVISCSSEVPSLFDDWCVEHNKHYESAEEKAQSEEKFNDNLKLIEELNALHKERSYRLED